MQQWCPYQHSHQKNRRQQEVCSYLVPRNTCPHLHHCTVDKNSVRSNRFFNLFPLFFFSVALSRLSLFFSVFVCFLLLKFEWKEAETPYFYFLIPPNSSVFFYLQYNRIKCFSKRFKIYLLRVITSGKCFIVYYRTLVMRLHSFIDY